MRLIKTKQSLGTLMNIGHACWSIAIDQFQLLWKRGPLWTPVGRITSSLVQAPLMEVETGWLMGSISAPMVFLGVSNLLDFWMEAGPSLHLTWLQFAQSLHSGGSFPQVPPVSTCSLFASLTQPNESCLDLAYHMFLQICCFFLELFLSFLKSFAP